ncbi:MAG: ferritin family protein [Candidatus Aminicenantes bacterium]|nr:ferritin family protein [Candidatus Aminicenantes bacterium]
MIDAQLKPHEILAVAIESEVDAAAFYTKLQEQVANEILLQKLKFLAFEEQKHRQVLGKLFGQRFAGQPMAAPEGVRLPKIGGLLAEDLTVFNLFEAALKAEESSEAFYNDAAKVITDEAGSRILGYLARVERSHQAIIKSEIDLLRRFPDYYKVTDFHLGQDMFHVGP